MRKEGKVTPQPVPLPSFFSLQAHDSLDSTSDEAKRLIEMKAPEGTLIWAKHQSKGRGRYGRTWQSPAGGLYFSLILRPHQDPVRAANHSFLAAVAVAEAIEGLLPEGQGHRVECKWPNDVLVDGQKIAGILLESGDYDSSLNTIGWMIVGIGINVQNDPTDVRLPATKVTAYNAEATLESVLAAVGRKLAFWLGCYGGQGFGPVRDAWLARGFGLGEKASVRLKDQTLEGTFDSLDDEGALLLRLADGRMHRVTAGEVFFDGLSQS